MLGHIIGFILFLAICYGVYRYIKRDPAGAIVQAPGTPVADPAKPENPPSKL